MIIEVKSEEVKANVKSTSALTSLYMDLPTFWYRQEFCAN